MTQISLKYYTEPSNTVQKPSNYLKLPSIRGRNSKLALNLHYWFKKSLINLGNYTMIQDFKKISSGRADLSSKFSRAGPGRLDLKILLSRPGEFKHCLQRRL